MSLNTQVWYVCEGPSQSSRTFKCNHWTGIFAWRCLVFIQKVLFNGHENTKHKATPYLAEVSEIFRRISPWNNTPVGTLPASTYSILKIASLSTSWAIFCTLFRAVMSVQICSLIRPQKKVCIFTIVRTEEAFLDEQRNILKRIFQSSDCTSTPQTCTTDMKYFVKTSDCYAMPSDHSCVRSSLLTII